MAQGFRPTKQRIYLRIGVLWGAFLQESSQAFMGVFGGHHFLEVDFFGNV
jgi:hypothetical protein